MKNEKPLKGILGIQNEQNLQWHSYEGKQACQKKSDPRKIIEDLTSLLIIRRLGKHPKKGKA